MKVLENNLSDGWSSKFKCTGKGHLMDGCGSLLGVDTADLYLREKAFVVIGQRGRVSGRRHEVSANFRCCVCGAQTCVSEELPKRVMDKLSARDEYRGPRPRLF